MGEPSIGSRVWTVGVILGLPVAACETAIVAVFYSDLDVVDRGRFLTFYGTSILILVGLTLGLGAGLGWISCSRKHRARGVRLGGTLAALILLGVRLAMIVRTGQVKIISLPGLGLIAFALAAAWIAGLAGQRLAFGRMARSRGGLIVLGGAMVLAVVAHATRSTDYAPPSPPSAVSAETRSAPLLENMNLLVICIDTLRADHLPSYGYARQTAPALEEVTRRGIRFEAITQRTATAGSVATMFTGTYPPTHRVLDNRDFFQDVNLTLAEVLARSGFYTVAAIANPAIGTVFNFHQGFREYLTPETQYEEMLESRHLNEIVLPTFDRIKDRRFFFWLHYKDPHRPYLVPEDYRDLYTRDELARAHGRHPSPTETAFGNQEDSDEYYRNRELDFAIAQYDAEIKFNDDSLRAVFDKLSEHGLWENTLVVVTSDHGESLGGHGLYFEHGTTVYEDNARVPLVFHHPRLPSGLVVEPPVSLVDLAPTLLDLLGLPRPPQMEGSSFAASVRGEAGATPRPHHFIISAWSYGYHTHAVRTRSHKLILDVDKRWLPFDALVERATRRWLPERAFNVYRCRRIKRELYDLEEDPEETVNLAGLDGEPENQLAGVLWHWLDTSYRPDRDTVRGDIPPEIEEALRSLGYVE